MAETEPKPDVPQKKRKRTGKEREERKRAAIQARLEAEAAAAAGETVADEPAVAPEPEAEAGVQAVKEEAPEADFDKIAQRIPAGLKKLHPVFKQAKKAETMRLIKKIRFLKSKSEDVSELEAQLNLLSAVQLHALATTHMRQKLKKHHKLKHIDMPAPIVEALPVNPSVSSSSSSATPDVIVKVENRLCSSKQVADAVKPVLSWVMCEAGASLRVTKGKDPKAKAKRAKVGSESEDESDDEGLVAGPMAGLDSDDEAVMEDKAADAAGWESGSVGGDEGGSDGDDSDSDDEGGMRIAPPSDSESEPEAPPKKKAKAPEPKPQPSKKEKKGKDDGTSSMFLPSLAAGFAVGDGDSDPDMDYDEDGTIGSKKAVRKNRRGQRARQAIWEKKYGKGAKHVVKAREEAEKKVRGPQGQKRDQGWGQRRDEPAAAPATPAAPAAKPAWRAAAEAPKPQNDGLHPSWEAAKLRKQRAVAKDAPKPTKIVFD